MKKFFDKCGSFFKSNYIIILIVLLAAFLRFYQLDVLPFGLYPDEAANGQDIIRMLENGDHRVIYDTNGPRESLFFYLQAIPVWVGGNLGIESLHYTPLALRMAAAFVGTLTVLGLYLLGKEMFTKKIGLIAAASLSVSAWHIQFSRNGFRAIMLPLALCFIFYFFFKAYKDGKLRDYILFAITMALGFYTYLSIRMLPLIFMALLVWLLIFNRKFIKENIKKLTISLSVFFVFLIPLLLAFVGDPSLMAGRASTSIFNPELNNGSWIGALANSIWSEVMMFNFKGDPNFRHNLAGTPMLDIILGVFFWIGLVMSLIKFKKLEHFTLLAWFGAMSLPMVLTAEGIPHALRVVGVIPVVFIWCALGIDFISKRIKNKKIEYAVLAILFSLVLSLNFYKYFIVYPQITEAREAYSEDMYIMGKRMLDLPSDIVYYAIVGEFGLKTVDFITNDIKPNIVQIEAYDILKEYRPAESNYVVYVTPSWYDEATTKFEQLGYTYDFTPVKSDLDGRVLYYEYIQK